MLHLLAQTVTNGDTINFSAYGAAGITVAILWYLLMKERQRADKATEQSTALLERVLPLLGDATGVIKASRDAAEAKADAERDAQLSRLEATIARLAGGKESPGG